MKAPDVAADSSNSLRKAPHAHQGQRRIAINYEIDGPEGAPWIVFSNSLGDGCLDVGAAAWLLSRGPSAFCATTSADTAASGCPGRPLHVRPAHCGCVGIARRAAVRSERPLLGRSARWAALTVLGSPNAFPTARPRCGVLDTVHDRLQHRPPQQQWRRTHCDLLTRNGTGNRRPSEVEPHRLTLASKAESGGWPYAPQVRQRFGRVRADPEGIGSPQHCRP